MEFTDPLMPHDCDRTIHSSSMSITIDTNEGILEGMRSPVRKILHPEDESQFPPTSPMPTSDLQRTQDNSHTPLLTEIHPEYKPKQLLVVFTICNLLTYFGKHAHFHPVLVQSDVHQSLVPHRSWQCWCMFG